MTKLNKVRLVCLFLATGLLFTMSFHEIQSFLDGQFGFVFPNFITQYDEAYFQWNKFWFENELPISSIPISAAMYPALFCLIYAVSGNVTKPPTPLIVSGPLIILLTTMAVVVKLSIYPGAM